MQTPALLRARWWAITNAWRSASLPRRLWLARFPFLGLLLPLALRAYSPDLSLRLLEAFASLDAMPALLLTLWVIMRLLPGLARQREDVDEWVVPRVYRPYWRWFTVVAAIAAALQIPVFIATAVALLSLANAPAGMLARELIVSLVVAGVAGVTASLLLSDTGGNVARGYPVLARVSSGKALLAFLPLAVFSEFVNLRRIMWLTVPVMLAAGVGASLNSVLRNALPWLTGVAALLLLDSIRVSILRLREWIPAVLLPTARVALQSAIVVTCTLLLLTAMMMLVRGSI